MERNWYDGIRIVTSRNSRIDKNWKPVYGERAVVKELYNACEIELAKTGSRKRMVLDVRAYNEGVAFRYRFVGGEYLKIEMSLPNLHFLKALLLGIPNGHRPLIIFCHSKGGKMSRIVR